jgi:serine phosphatase RsbU (regulator of sigma subunit)/purine-cytosine permease-like protein
MTIHTVEKTRRQYNHWVANESIEDYALRYSPSSFRKWSPLLLANTAIGSISFLALEAIGASLLLSYGYTNAMWAILLASFLIFAAGLPISYYAARYNIDIDLLTRSAGFGYVGSTLTSLIYASFCFIFFALEAAIMAQALKLYIELPLYLGYILCSLIIFPIVFYGITAINRLHLWTQPVWLVLMVMPFYFLYTQSPNTIDVLTNFKGQLSGGNGFDPYYFGIATGISLSLIVQIGEQVDYLRFMPNQHKGNRVSWWVSLFAAGPGWIVLGCFKQIAGMLLASIVVLAGLGYAEAKEPAQMYYIAYTYVFDHPQLAIFVSTIFIVISQIKINVTNAYAGSLAWSNFFSRVTHAHPGRVVWLVFNIGIALLLMEMGVFEVLQKVLGLYSNVAIAWVFAVVADLTINKVLKLSPPIIEFKRAHLYNFNPVGFVSMLVASLVSIIAFTGAFGLFAQAYSWLIAMTISLILVPVIAKLTKSKYYIARENVHFESSDEQCFCGVCSEQYSQTDFAYCPYYEKPICSLCCTLDSSCKDQCKPLQVSIYRQVVSRILTLIFKHSISKQTAARISQFLLISGVMLLVVAITFWLSYSMIYGNSNSQSAAEYATSLFNLFFVLGALISIAAWWIVLVQESRALAEAELHEQNESMMLVVTAREKAEKFEYFRSHTLEMLAGESALSSILEAIVLGVEQLNSAMRCSIWLLDNKEKCLVNGIAPTISPLYLKAIDGFKIASGTGSCGIAALSGVRVIVDDISMHPAFESLKELAANADLGACWSQPIRLASGQVLGTFSIYHDEMQTPKETDIYLIEQSARLAGVAIEYKRGEEQLKEAHGYINSELEIARNLQIDILPAYFPVANGCDGSARMLPATTMGGDFYDFIELPCGKLGLVMADVSGKGVPAAFFMAVARTTLRLIAATSSGPGECLQRTNDILCAQNPMYLFVTVFYAVFDPVNGQLIYANGGHNPPVMRHADGTIEMLRSFGDAALGVIEDVGFQEHLQQFAPGDSLILYTDGVTEAFNPEWEEYGEGRMLEQVALFGNQNAKALVTAIFDSVISFAGTAPQSDDITITVLKWEPL